MKQRVDDIRGLTIRQPWASLLAIGAKRIETRSWRTHYRGPVLLHSSASRRSDELQLEQSNEIRSALNCAPTAQLEMTVPLPRGQVLAIGQLVDVVSADLLRDTINASELGLGDYSTGRYGWIFADVRPLPHPVAATGSLNLWHPTSLIARLTLAQVDVDDAVLQPLTPSLFT